jgi:hypothetical protein
VAREKIMRHAFEVIARKAQAFLRVNAPYMHWCRTPESRTIGHAMFDSSWNRFYTALSTVSDRTKDVDLLRICLDGLAYGSTIAIQLGSENERLAFTRQLAKITFIERNRSKTTTHKLLCSVYLFVLILFFLFFFFCVFCMCRRRYGGHQHHFAGSAEAVGQE